MARRRYEWTEARVQKYVKEGRGRGEGAAYKPWLTVFDVPSMGRVHRVTGLTTGRVHHLLSDGEYRYLLQCDWQPGITDVREQFPMDREVTYRIARALRIRHPMNKDGTPYVMTTDFVLSVGDESAHHLLARTYKPSYALDNRRVLEKLEIERRYWQHHGVDWAIVTEQDVDQQLVRNIQVVRNFYHLEGLQEPFPGCFNRLASEFADAFQSAADPESITLGQLCCDLDAMSGVSTGTSLVVAKHLLARRSLVADMRASGQLERWPLAAFHLSRGLAPFLGGT
jgi:hypothetical protein